MKKFLAVLLAFALVLGGCSKDDGKTVWEEIKLSPAAKLELPDGPCAYVDSEIDLVRSFADLELVEVQVATDGESGWLYRISFNPSDRVLNVDEIVVSFYKGYVQVGEEYYTAPEGVEFESVLQWAESKFDYFVK